MNEHEGYFVHCTSTFNSNSLYHFNSIRFGIDITIIGINLIDVYRFARCPNVSFSWHSFESSSSSIQHPVPNATEKPEKSKKIIIYQFQNWQWSNASFELNFFLIIFLFFFLFVQLYTRIWEWKWKFNSNCKQLRRDISHFIFYISTTTLMLRELHRANGKWNRLTY